MAQIVKLRRSSASGKVPTISNLELGELAMNTYDGRIFFEKNTNGTITIEEIVTTDAERAITGSINLNGNFYASSFNGTGLFSSSQQVDYNSIQNQPTIPSAANNGALTVQGTGVLGGSGTFTANQGSDETISITHDSVTRTNNTSTASPSAGGTFTAIDSITTSNEGHITAVNTKTITLPSGTTPRGAGVGLTLNGNNLDFDGNGTGVVSGSSQLTSDLDLRYLEINGDSVVSGSSQITLSSVFGYDSAEHFTQAEITTVGNVTSGDVSAILPSGVISGSSQISISSTNISDVDAFSQSGTYASLRAQGTTKGDVGLGNVENTALSTWGGSSNITTIGTVTTGNVNAILPSGIVSSSDQLTSNFLEINGDSVFSSSAQVDYTSIQNKPTISNQQITLAGSGGLTVSNNGTFTLNQSSAETFTIGTNGSGIVSGSDQLSGVFLEILGDSVFSSSAQVDYNSIQNKPTIPSVGNGTITFEGDDNVTISTNTSFTTNQSSDATILIGLNGGIVSQSAQISAFNTFLEINGDGVFSGSSQVDYNSIQNKPTIGNGTLTVQGTGALGGSGTFTANQSGAGTISITHDTITPTANTSTASPSHGGTFTVIDSVTFDSYGHPTAYNTKTVTLPNDNNTTYSAGTGLDLTSTTFSFDGNGTGVFSGSAQVDYNSIQNKPTIPTVGDGTITFEAGTNLSGGGTITTNQSADETITFNLDTNGTGIVSGSYVTSVNSSTGAVTLTLDDVSVANLKTRLAGGFGSNAVQIGDSSDTVTIPGNLVVTGTTTTNNVQTVSTSNGVVFEGNAADAYELTLLAGTLSADRTITLPDTDGTLVITSGTYSNLRAQATTKGDVGLGSVENTALSTWAGSSNITTLGTISTGTWQGNTISDDYISSAGTWNAKQDALTFGIANTNAVKINSTSVADNDYAKFTSSGLEGRSYTEVKSDLSLNNVENTALSTWAGTSNITTLGTISTGTWQGTAIADAYLSSNTAHLSGTQTFTGAKSFSSAVNIDSTTESTSKTSGALIVDGGVGIAKNINVGGNSLFGDSLTDSHIFSGSVTIEASGSTVFDVQGSSGQLFSLTDSLSGDIFSVGDISGDPIFNVNSNGTVTIEDQLDVSGSIYATGDVVAYASSDERFKDNITPISNPTEKIKQIGGYTYDWNDTQDTYEVGTHDVGVIAQEIEKVLPEVVTTRDNGYKAVKYDKIVALLIESNKELIQRVEELEKKLEDKNGNS